jgi:gliding motility-associated-like protein
MDKRAFSTILLTLFSLLCLSQKITVGPTPLTLIIHSIDPACNASSGAIFANAIGGTPPYTYTFKGINVGSQSDFQELQPGAYTVTVTDATGATATQNVTLTQKINPPQVTVTSYTNPTGCGQDDGTITLGATGGTPPYLYSSDLVNWQTSNFFSNLPSNSALDLYPLYVQDANGCRSFAPNSPILVSNCPINIWGWDYLSLIYGCGGATSHIYITGVSGGTAPYTYSLDGTSYQASPKFDNLGEGFYRVRVKDATGLTTIQGFLISDECQVTATYTTTDASCNHNDATLTISAKNGNPPYAYSIDGLNFQSSNVFTSMHSGNYRILVRELYGNTFTLLATIFDDCPMVTAITTNETCGSGNGTITADGSNGTAPYQYSIDGTNFQTNPLFKNLSAGNYTVYIQDSRGFTQSTSITLSNNCLQASAIATSSTCGRPNGSIAAQALNGTPPYQYSIDGTNFQTSPLFDQYLAGNYIITVIDATGTKVTTMVTINDIPGPGISVITTAASCLNNDGTIAASNIGGNAPFEYSIDGASYQSTGRFSGLQTGPKTVYIKDANGCTANQTATVPLNNNLFVDAGPDKTICEGKSAGLAGQTNGLSNSWSPALGLSDPSVLNPVASPATTTQYTLTVSDGVCDASASMNIFVNPAPIANAGNNISTCYGKSVQLTGSGGACTWSPAQGLDDPASYTPVVTMPKETITYRLVVRDGNGCSSLAPAEVTVTVTPPAKVFIGNDTSVLIGQPLQLNAEDVNNSGFNSYSWTPEAGLSNPFVRDPVAHPGENIIYRVAASTPDGCVGIDSIAVKVYLVSDIFVPGAFTPNGDGHNDVLKPIAIGIRDFKLLAVYNRWGQIVFQTNDPERGWDGTINGQSQGSGTFVWMAWGVDYSGRVVHRRGTVVLVR